TKNALSVSNVGAAKLIPESDLTPDSLFQEVNEIMSSESIQKEMSEKSKKIGVPDAADRLIKILTDLVNK
ncbi:MAG TPA: UDP-N-acetylglucosamine--N-acetylmuramyl-(pentapeptide) pyrophosphoryl-undecaprenol N-acetylglucosamine transferase, partial [Candidatus Companilactobacillus pullicola]|nr:UDP-N-acetylglucosamine--N-acetylmuramyl-(pentapeptide) pyrophosphoryl-undecaprenol N-acetylglucosamine transferase [Candidatus Companilactobacillus pullicola]